MLNLVVHNVSTRSQSTENQNMLIYYDPGTVHALSTGFSCFSVNSQRDVPILNIVCTFGLLETGYLVSKWLGHSFDHPHTSRGEVKEEVELYLYFPLGLHGLFYVNYTFIFYLLLPCPFRVPTDSQRSGLVKICYRHPQLNYFLTCWQSTVIT